MADGMKARLQRFNLFTAKQEQKDVSEVENAAVVCVARVSLCAVLGGHLANINRGS